MYGRRVQLIVEESIEMSRQMSCKLLFKLNPKNIIWKISMRQINEAVTI